MAARPQAERPLLQAVKYLLDTCIIEALLKEEAGKTKFAQGLLPHRAGRLRSPR